MKPPPKPAGKDSTTSKKPRQETASSLQAGSVLGGARKGRRGLTQVLEGSEPALLGGKAWSQTDGGILCYKRKRRRSLTSSPAAGLELLKDVTNVSREHPKPSRGDSEGTAEPTGSSSCEAESEPELATRTRRSKSLGGLPRTPSRKVATLQALRVPDSQTRLKSPLSKASPASSRRGFLSPPRQFIEEQTSLFAGVDAFQLEEEDERTSPDTSQEQRSEHGSNPTQEAR